MSLPAPESVVADAVGGDAPSPAVNVVTADPDAAGDADRDDDEGAYVGPDAAVCGHLAAAVRVAGDRDDVAVHHGDVDLTAEGPWVVLAPLDGAIATVSTGTATTTVHLASSDARPRSVREKIDDVLAAATATHGVYPVADDDAGVFLTGMTTFELASVTPVADGLRVAFETSTTPATTRGDIESRFLDVDAVTAVDVTFEAGVERSSPSAEFRGAVETAHRDRVGDAAYEWLPRPTAFARLPGGQKVAFGTGTPGGRFAGDDVEATAALLRTVASQLEVRV